MRSTYVTNIAADTVLGLSQNLLYIDSSAVPIQINLPKLSDLYAYNPLPPAIQFIDINVAGPAHNITFFPDPDDTISGNSNISLRTNGSMGMIVPIGDNTWGFISLNTSNQPGSIDTVDTQTVTGFTMTILHVPAFVYGVYKNGQLLTLGEDYTRVGAEFTFINELDGDLINIVSKY